MNGTLKVLVVIVAYICFSGQAWAQTTFERSFGGAFYDVGNEVIETPDHDYLIFGTTRSASNDTTDAYLLRLDENGDTLWTKIYGGKLEDSGVSIAFASDGGYTLALASNSFNPGNYDIHLVKIQENGDTLWTRTYGGPGTDYVHSMQSTSDNGYIVLAHTLSFGAGSLDFYLLKVDENGDSLWTRTYGGPESDWGGFVQQTADDGYILTGDTYSFNDPSGDIYLIKTNSFGDTLWTRTYGGTEYDRAYHVLQTLDGGYVISGVTQSYGEADINGYLIRTNSTGDTLWTKVLGGAYICSLSWCEKTSDGNYVAIGSIRDFGFGKGDAFMVKFDPDGNILWTRVFGGPENDSGKCIIETRDGGFVIVGGTGSFTIDQNDDVYIIKTNDAGNFTSVENTRPTMPPSSGAFLICYPNPFHTSTRIIFKVNKAEYVSLRILDLSGKEIETLLREDILTNGEYEILWSADHVASGYYLCQLKIGDSVFTKMLLFQK